MGSCTNLGIRLLSKLTIFFSKMKIDNQEDLNFIFNLIQFENLSIVIIIYLYISK